MIWPTLLAIASSLASAAGPIYLKQGLNPLTITKLFLGFFLYGLGVLLFIAALFGGELSKLYPLIALTYVWVVLLSKFWLKEKITRQHIIGMIAIILGVAIISL